MKALECGLLGEVFGAGYGELSPGAVEKSVQYCVGFTLQSVSGLEDSGAGNWLLKRLDFGIIERTRADFDVLEYVACGRAGTALKLSFNVPGDGRTVVSFEDGVGADCVFVWER